MESLFFHPKMVHVPMALAVLMPLVALGLFVAWWRRWLPARAWIVAIALQAILFGSGILAMRSGEAEEHRVEHVVAEQYVEAHEEAAEVFVWTSGGVLVLMLLAGSLARGRGGLLAAGVATAATVVVFGLGYRVGEAGGALVYEHGAAQPQTAAAVGPSGRMHAHDDDD